MSKNPYVKLARLSLEYYLKHDKFLELPNDLPNEMTTEKAGVFVSLKKHGHLRACIGTFQASTDSIANEIIQNAVSAGLRDPRFGPVELSEIDQITFSVDVLKEATLVKDISQLDPKRFGLIVTYKNKSALLLPNLQGVNSVEQQLSIVLQKASINYKDDYILEKFEVIRHQ